MKETLIQQRERESFEKGKPEFPKGYVEIEMVGLFREGEEPVGFWECFKKFLQFGKWDYTK